MNKIIYFLLLCIVGNTMQSQTIYERFNSMKLGGERQIKILLPRGYDSKDAKKYPVIYVLDGDYMFEAVAGNADYYAYWEDIPDAIVVGVKVKLKQRGGFSHFRSDGKPKRSFVSFDAAIEEIKRLRATDESGPEILNCYACGDHFHIGRTK